MKSKILIAIFALLISWTPFFAQNNEPGAVRHLSPFSKIKVFGKINCKLVKGREGRIEIFSSQELAEKISTELSGHELKIKMQIDLIGDPVTEVIVYYKELDEFTASAGAYLESEENFNIDQAEVSAYTGSEITLKIVSDELVVSSDQGSKVSLNGKCRSLNATINTGGKINCKNYRGWHSQCFC
jgi:putative autotransporter adhesin-like protein